MKKLSTLAFTFALALGATSLAQNITIIVKATTLPCWQTVFDGAKAAAEKLGVMPATQGAAEEYDFGPPPR